MPLHFIMLLRLLQSLVKLTTLFIQEALLMLMMIYCVIVWVYHLKIR